MRFIFAITSFAAALTFALPSVAGPVFLTGHDPDFHAQTAGADGTGAQNLLNIALGYFTGSTHNTAGSKFLWVESRITKPSGHEVGEVGLGTIGLTLGTHYDRANATEFGSVDLSAYTAIAIASSFGGLLTRAELDALIARKTDIKNFINAGGGLFAGSECDGCGNDLLGVNPDLFGYLPIDVTSINASPDFTPTAFGLNLGLVFGDLQSPTHNSFGLTGGLNIVDTDSSGNATTLAGNVFIDEGGFTSTIPEPAALVLFGLGLLGLGMARRRKKRAA
jgi:hypothetical protein